MPNSSFICVKDKDCQNIHLIDIENESSSTVKPSSSPQSKCYERTALSPNKQKLALSIKNQVEVYDIAKKKSKKITVEDTVKLCEWLSDSKLAIVTTSRVYHLLISNFESIPGSSEVHHVEKIFYVHSSFDGGKILRYKIDATQKWPMLIGKKAGNDGMKGTMQLYSLTKKVTQAVAGYVCAFMDEYSASGTIDPPLPLISLVSVSLPYDWNVATPDPSLFIMELPVSGLGMLTYQQKMLQLKKWWPFKKTTKKEEMDYPIFMESLPYYEVFLMISRFGMVLIFDAGTGTIVYSGNKLFDKLMKKHESLQFIGKVNGTEDGIVGVTGTGHVISVKISGRKLLSYLQKDTKIMLEVKFGLMEKAKVRVEEEKEEKTEQAQKDLKERISFLGETMNDKKVEIRGTTLRISKSLFS